MEKISFKGKNYDTDTQDFLLDHEQWDEDFAAGMAEKVDIPGSLSEQHWDVIGFIKDSFKRTGECPLVYETCRSNGLSLKDLKKLFPTGYLRGACKLAGITYRDRFVNYYGEPGLISRTKADYKETRPELKEKVYRVDVLGFLVDPSEWDENFASNRAHDMKIQGALSDKHWEIIHFLRDRFEKNGVVPTVFECCEVNHIELEELERLFPDGYHRGAVKIAGLRAR